MTEMMQYEHIPTKEERKMRMIGSEKQVEFAKRVLDTFQDELSFLKSVCEKELEKEIEYQKNIDSERKKARQNVLSKRERFVNAINYAMSPTCASEVLDNKSSVTAYVNSILNSRGLDALLLKDFAHKALFGNIDRQKIRMSKPGHLTY